MGYGKHVKSMDSVALIKEVERFCNSHKKNPVPFDYTSFEPTNPTLMVDWLSLKFIFWSDEHLNGGNVISTNQDGEIDE